MNSIVSAREGMAAILECVRDTLENQDGGLGLLF